MYSAHTYLHYGSGLSEDIVEGVARNPDHGGHRHQETEALRPLGVGVVVTVLDGLVGDAVEDEHPEHDGGGEVFPTEVPELVGPVSSHLLHTLTKPDDSKIELFIGSLLDIYNLTFILSGHIFRKY